MLFKWQAKLRTSGLAILVGVFSTAAAAEGDFVDKLMDDFSAMESAKPAAGSIDDLLQGFDGGDGENWPRNHDLGGPGGWSYDGFVSLASAYNYQRPEPSGSEPDFSGLSRLRIKYFPKISFDSGKGWKGVVSASTYYDAIFSFKDRDKFTDEYISDTESELELREANVGGSIADSIDIKIGRQVLAWGTSDYLRVVDVINPVDVREPGLVDLEDVRLPVFMIRGDYYVRNWALNVAVIPEFMGDKVPVFGSDFYGSQLPPPPQIRPGYSISDWQYALALKGTYSGWGLSFHWADVYEHQPQYVFGPPGLQYEYNRIHLLGWAADVAAGSWLLKGEMAYIDGLEYAASGAARLIRYDALIGVEYSGMTDQTLGFEAVGRYIKDFPAAIGGAPDYKTEVESQLVIRHTANYRHDTLSSIVSGTFFSVDVKAGAIYQASLSFKPIDAWKLTAGIIVYVPGTAEYSKTIEKSDRIFIEIRYDY